MSIFSIGAGALSAAQQGLLTAGHNIANANTAGYSRQRIEQGTNVPQQSGSGFIGNGVHVDTIRRQYDTLLAAEGRNAQAQASHSQAFADQLGRIDGLLADPLSGLSPAIDAFFGALHDVASRPADPASRQNMLGAAQSLAGRMHDLDGQLAELRRSNALRVQASVAEINSLGAQIAELNLRILAAGSSAAQPANDLLDQRDRLVDQLSQQTAISVVQADNGDYSVFLGTGQALVLRDQSFALAVRPDPLDAENLQVGLQVGGSIVAFSPGQLAGGQLGGLLGFRDQALTAAQNSLGRIAIALADAFNQQHRLGLDRNGAPGGDFFSLATPQVLTTSAAAVGATIADSTQLAASDYRLAYDGANYTLTRLADGAVNTFAAFPQTIDGLGLTLAGPAPAAGDSFLIRATRGAAAAFGVLLSDSSRIAAAAPVRTGASVSNTGNATIGASAVDAAYLAAPLGAPVTLTYDAATGMLSGLPATAPFAYTPGATISWNGISFAISGTPRDGDTFTLEPNVNGTGDNRNAVALAALQNARLAGGATLQQSYGELVASVGNRAREMTSAAESQATLLERIAEQRDSISGVNLDEEAADLMRYQQAYQAAGKLIGIAAELFDTLLGLGR